MKLSVRAITPSGERYRAGMKFTTHPTTVEVDEAQAEAILADEYLVAEEVAEPVAEPVEVDEAQAEAKPKRKRGAN